MPVITLPDGSTKSFDGPVRGDEIAASIGTGLAKAALAIRLGDTVMDLDTTLTVDTAVSIVTAKDPDALELFRHDAAHLLAEAAKELFPGVQVTFGPATENGFYYDFAREDPFSTYDLEALEKRMKEIVDRNEPITRKVVSREEAIEYFSSIGEKYKAEWIPEIPAGDELKVYTQGQFTDLCRGPHLPSTGKLGKAFKLLRVSGAYWRGDANNDQLQRIYGTCFPTQKELDAYLTMLEEAEKRDHRRIGKEMNLFHMQEEALGSTFWHPRGWTLYREIESYMRRKLDAADYHEIKTPQLVDRSLWEASGHWEKFRENMFSTHTEDGRIFALKPMNCPGHVQVFKQGIKSYRDLPLRYAEMGSCHRYEPHGALHGIMRVRNFTQDDAHIFCTEDQITEESIKFCGLLLEVYKDFGYEDVRVKFSDRPEKRAGTDETWDRAEDALRQSIEAAGLPYTMNPGEGAFYGPKLEFVLRDAIGRDWQCGTLQVDFVMPERLDAHYTAEDGGRHRPVMLHRAILGSFERWIGILIEQHAGRFPLWLSPVQATVATITSDADDYAHEVVAALKAAGLRTDIDVRNEKINYKVREHSHAKTPAILVVGRREAEERTVAVRRLGTQKQEFLALDEAVTRLASEARPPA